MLPVGLASVVVRKPRLRNWQVKDYFNAVPGVSRTIQVAVDDFVTACVNCGAWERFDLVQWYGLSLINLARPGYARALLVNSPTKTAFGYSTDGIANYIDTNINISNAVVKKFGQNSACFGFRTRTVAGITGTGCGWIDGANDGVALNTGNTVGALKCRVNAVLIATTADGAIASGAYFAMANRSGATSTEAYADGLALTLTSNATAASLAVNNVSLSLGRTTATNFTAQEYVNCFIGGSLTATQHAAVAAAEHALSVVLGAV